MNRNIWAYLFVMSLVSFIIRVLPVTLIRRQIKNRFIRSLLFYLPYATLAVMTFPAILSISENPLCGAAAFAASLLTAWFTKNLFLSAIFGCAAAFLTALLI
ncbi:MAG: AzlD domain-containing protein [Anaerolineaceae bacterium]|nr:AzlD domain-containing protein [Anaerolineaceae bacterium]